MFMPSLKKTFDVLDIQLISPKNQQLPLDKFLCWFTYVYNLLKNIQTTILIKKISY